MWLLCLPPVFQFLLRGCSEDKHSRNVYGCFHRYDSGQGGVKEVMKQLRDRPAAVS